MADQSKEDGAADESKTTEVVDPTAIPIDGMSFRLGIRESVRKIRQRASRFEQERVWAVQARQRDVEASAELCRDTCFDIADELDTIANRVATHGPVSAWKLSDDVAPRAWTSEMKRGRKA